MRVLYDHQIFSVQKFGGISRYFAELLGSIDPEVLVELATKYSDNQHLAMSYPDHVVLPLPGKTKQRIPVRVANAVLRRLGRSQFHDPQQLALAANEDHSLSRLRSQGFDVFHPTYYSDYFLEDLGRTRLVVTVYDMIHELFQESFPLSDRTAVMKDRLIHRADRILAISESTKADLVSFYPEVAGKVDVVYLGPPFSPLSGPVALREPPPNLPERYLLFTGVRSGYKNFYLLVRTLAPFLKKDRNLYLVCTGHAMSEDELRFFDSLGIAHQVRHVFANDILLMHLYQKALAFVFPSLYEGFGFPILEAFAAGCPALLSDSSSLAEIGGDAAEYFHPKDPTSIEHALHRVLSDSDLRGDLCARGRMRVQKFSWEETIRQTHETYRRALSDITPQGQGV